MATTSPDAIYSADVGTNLSIQAITGTMAGSIQAALDRRALISYEWPDSAARISQTGMLRGYEGYQRDTDTLYRYNGSAWRAWETDWVSSTPTPTAESGSFTAATSTMIYKLSSGVVQLNATVSITAAGTAAGSIFLPLPYASSGTWVVFGRETQLTGASLAGTIASGGAQMNIINYNNATVIANDRTAVMSGMYRPA